MLPELDFEWTIEAFYDKNYLNQTQQETLSTKSSEGQLQNMRSLLHLKKAK